ncbi:Lactamase-B domain-containing protein [Aphelenchoides besseyi]|nr:Lactamase-B domain-containing protein [Aphelenchoides besseyi]
MALLFRQLFEPQSSTYTYLLACRRTRKALIIDPVLEVVNRDVQLIKELGLDLIYGLNTHLHADHITSTGSLKTHFPQMKSVLSKLYDAKADIRIDHGDTIETGDVKLQVLATPGHTDGCLSYVSDGLKSVFTGDALLIRGCGRTDFQQGSSHRLYKSVHERLFTLPDEYLVWPAHDYKGLSSSTIGEEKTLNPRLTKSESEFVDMMNKLQLPYPKAIDRALPANRLCGIVEEVNQKAR